MDDKEKDQEIPLDNQKDHAERIIDIDQAYCHPIIFDKGSKEENLTGKSNPINGC